MFAEIMEIVLDALLDSLKVFPFLFLMYVLIEFLENRTNITKNKNILRGNLAPLLGAATGIIPQCGFSVMAASPCFWQRATKRSSFCSLRGKAPSRSCR